MTSLRFIKFFILCLLFNITFTSSSIARHVEENSMGCMTWNEIKSKLENELGKTYQFLLVSLNSDEKEFLIQSQKKWLEETNKLGDDLTAIEKAYIKRIDDLDIIAKPYLEMTISTFINSKPTINYNDLDEPLSKCSMYEVCKAYKAFIDYERSKKTPADFEKAKKLFLDIGERTNISLYGYYETSIRSAYKEILDKEGVKAFLYLLAQRPTYDTSEEHEAIPVWLVLKHPKILALPVEDERFTIHVNEEYFQFADKKIIYDFIDTFYEISPYYIEYNTRCYGSMGTMYRYIAASHYMYLEKLSFAPSLVKIVNADPVYERLEVWSYYGIWNRLLYKKFLSQKELAIKALSNFYEQNYNLKSFAPKAESLLSSFVDYSYYGSLGEELSKSFKLVRSIKGTVLELEAKTKDFTKEDFSEMLRIAILADFPLDSIEFLIKAGADVNNKYQDETPLMNAVTRPNILKLLLSNGANIEDKTLFGKTALFYAVQFGGKESVELLLKNGANINSKLITLDDMEATGEVDGSLRICLEHDMDVENIPMRVYGFTPLVYALRYGDEEVIDLLIARGANLGNSHKDQITEWVLSGEKITKEILEQRLARVK